MSLPKISTQVQNGRLGLTTQTADNVVGLVVQGVSTAAVALNAPTLITSLADAEIKGFTAAYDTTNAVKVWQHIKEFFAEAGNGAELWLLLRGQADTMVAMLTADVLKVLCVAADYRVKVVGIARNPAVGYTPVIVGMDADITAALPVAQSKALELEALYAPIRVILDGYGLTNNTTALPNLTTFTANKVGVLVGGTLANFNSVGLLMGRIARIPVQRKIGRVKDGALNTSTGFVGTATVVALGETTIGLIHDKGYITLRKHVSKAGFYFSFDPTATAATDDYSTLTNGRVIDKALRLCYATYLNELLDEIPIDPTTGNIEPATAKYYQSILENAVNQTMTANGEISGFRAVVDPAQNVISTGRICADVYITPLGYAFEIQVKLGFENPSI